MPPCLALSRPLDAYFHTLTFGYGKSCSVSHTMRAALHGNNTAAVRSSASCPSFARPSSVRSSAVRCPTARLPDRPSARPPAFLLALGSPFSHTFSAAISPPAALFERSGKTYSLFLNGLTCHILHRNYRFVKWFSEKFTNRASKGIKKEGRLTCPDS